MKPRKKAEPQAPYNDLDLTRWKEYEEIWTDSLWQIPHRARGNGHRLEYHGNFVPQIATQTFQRFTRAGEIVLDLFLGSGTSAVEALRLGRRCIGVELKPELVEHVWGKLGGDAGRGTRDAGRGTRDAGRGTRGMGEDSIPDSPFQSDRAALVCGDSGAPESGEAVRKALKAWDAEYADLLMLHPPYADIIRFSDRAECLSNAESTTAFLEGFRRVATQGYALLKPGRFAVLVIGDKYQDGELVPLGFECMRVMNETGFRTKSIVVKNIEGNEVGKGKASNLWRYRALRSGFYVFKHEYVIILQRPG